MRNYAEEIPQRGLLQHLGLKINKDWEIGEDLIHKIKEQDGWNGHLNLECFEIDIYQQDWNKSFLLPMTHGAKYWPTKK